jgi:carbonic anhydrase
MTQLTTLSGLTAKQALARLEEGNARFMDGKSNFPTHQPEILAELAKGQQPYVTILGCSDSRVPPELIFDAGLGELFIIRVAGNVLGPTIAGTLQYASTQLHTPLFVVLGHQGCGAIKAALALKLHAAEHPEKISLLLEVIMPALENINTALPAPELLVSAVEANVRYTVKRIEESPEGRAHLESTQMRVIGAICDLDTGHVRFLE